MLDGSDFPKQGRKSVGVARQYCGRLGKVANCQAGMFLAYVSLPGRALVDKRLYLPESWTSDTDRCAAAGVPEESRNYRSKTKLALEMLERALERGHLKAGWVAGDDAFGLPGTGKTHALCAIGHRLVEAGHSVLFAPAYRLVQELLAAKRDLDLPRQLRKLDNFDFLLLDDLGYLPQGAEESEVLFTLIAERYERRSLGITSNLVFSEWERIFANPMATAAAIDRVVHHSVILEFDVPSYRTDALPSNGARPRRRTGKTD